MYTSFQNISDKARIWIYQANRRISNEESVLIEDKMKSFLEQWTAHGQDLHASAVVMDNYFLMVALDEKISQASGCSIDASVHYIQELQQSMSIDFFDRTKVVLEKQNERVIQDFKEVAESIKSNAIEPAVLTYNNLISYKAQLDSEWKIPLEESWLKKYFVNKNTVA